MKSKNISVYKKHNYTEDKVKIALTFLENNPINSRNLNIDDLYETYSLIKGVQTTRCKRCNYRKYIIFIQNYAKYGKLILEKEGVIFDEDKKEDEIDEDKLPNRIYLGDKEEDTEPSPSPTEEEVKEETPKKETPTKKRGRPKNKK